MQKGIDLSYSNKVTDWQQVKAAVDFVILRAGYGKDNVDENLVPYAAACMEHNIPLGLYWFSYAYTVEMARNEALYCIRQAKKYNITYPIAFDFEYDSVHYAQTKGINVTPELVMAMTVAFCHEIEKAGYVPVVYTNKDYANRYFDIEQLKALNYNIWYAYYNKELDRKDVVLWQYSSKGTVPGITGNVDMNYSLREVEEKKFGWQYDNGRWWWLNPDGTYPANVWLEVDGKYYRFDEEGWMRIGWVSIGEHWYYLKSDGSMAANEVLTIHDDEFGDEVYAFGADGHMLRTNPASIRGDLL